MEAFALLLSNVLALNAADRGRLVSVTMRYMIETGEVEASTLRTTIDRIQRGEEG